MRRKYKLSLLKNSNKNKLIDEKMVTSINSLIVQIKENYI